LRLASLPEGRAPGISPTVWQRVLDRVSEGILVVDHTGTLLFANATWASWTGFSAEELRQRPAPFPFWISHHDLVGDPWALVLNLGHPEPGTGLPQAPAGGQGLSCLPFQQRDQTVFWCQVELAHEQIEGRSVTIASLRRLPARMAPASAASTEPRPEAVIPP